MLLVPLLLLMLVEEEEEGGLAARQLLQDKRLGKLRFLHLWQVQPSAKPRPEVEEAEEAFAVGWIPAARSSAARAARRGAKVFSRRLPTTAQHPITVRPLALVRAAATASR